MKNITLETIYKKVADLQRDVVKIKKTLLEEPDCPMNYREQSKGRYAIHDIHDIIDKKLDLNEKKKITEENRKFERTNFRT